MSTPHQENQLVQIVSSRSWLTLLGIGLIITAALVWAFIGTIPTTVSGTGVLIRGGRTSPIISQASGFVTSFNIKIGDHVKVGQIVATIRQPLLAVQILDQKLAVSNAQKHLESIKLEENELFKAHKESLKQQTTSAEEAILANKKQLETLNDIVKAQEELLKEGLIPLTSLMQLRSQRDTANLNILTANSQIKQIKMDDVSESNSITEKITQAELSLQQEKDKLYEFETQLRESSEVKCEVAGVVISLLSGVHREIRSGEQIAEIENEDLEMQGLLFFPLGPGKEIFPEMLVKISPDTAPVDEYGYMIGRVKDIGRSAQTMESAMALIANQTFVEQYVGHVPMIRVDVRLEKNEMTPSQFKWTSSKGPSTAISGGTPCHALVIVKNEHPIELMIPLLKKVVVGDAR